VRTRTLATALLLVAALLLSLVGTASARVDAGERAGAAEVAAAKRAPGDPAAAPPPAGSDPGPAPAPPKAAEPKGPGPIYQINQYGPSPSDNVVLKWNEQALSAIRATNPGPTVVARALCVLQTSVFDAWAAYTPTAVGTRYGGKLRRPAGEHTDQHKSKAISYAAYRTLLDLFPSRASDFTALMSELGYDPADESLDTATPQGIGNAAAAANIAFRSEDGSNQRGGYADTAGYASVNTADVMNDPYRWQPLRLPTSGGGTVDQTFLTPHWRDVKPFALTKPDQFPVAGPTLNKKDEYEKQMDKVLKASAELNDRTKVIAEYWADGPASELPPGHWNVFAQATSRRYKNTLDQDVALFFGLNGALLDASIAAWDAKVRYDFGRPVTMINELRRGRKVRAWAGPYQGTKEILGETWRPYQPATALTPPFAEYVSGHSTFSAAGARVLRAYQQYKGFKNPDEFGISVTVKARTGRVEPDAVPAKDVTLFWPTFTAAADEAGISRLYGGIHFDDGDLHGRVLGESIGDQAVRKAIAYLQGNG
jgi:hypothetical protein